MEHNVGGTDRTVRCVLGGILAVVGALGYAGMVPVAFGPFPQALTALVLVVVGIVLVATAQTRKCPINKAVGRNTAD